MKPALLFPPLLALGLSCSSGETSVPVMNLELHGGNGQVLTLTGEDITALPSTTGFGGILTSAGDITPPTPYRGVSLMDLVDLVGGLTADDGAQVIASDDYAVTFAGAQIRESAFLSFDPVTGDQLSGAGHIQTVLSFERSSELLTDEEGGPLRLTLLSERDDRVTEGHHWVRQVEQVRVIPLDGEWRLLLEGAIHEELSRTFFEAGAAPGCHGITWTDEQGQEWTGIPLWLLLGWIDDENPHRDVAFDRRLAETGYDVDVVGRDGTTVTLDSAALNENNGIILAHLVDGVALEEPYFPLRLVGADLVAEERIGQVTAIVAYITN